MEQETNLNRLSIVQVKEKPEGAKRPILVDKEYVWSYDEVKYTKYLIKF